MLNREKLLLYAVTDRTWLNGRQLYDDVKKALQGGVTMIQLREKNADFDSFTEEAKQLLPLCRQYGAPLIINDRIDVCIAADADGVHLGQGDTPVEQARKMLGNDKIIGITAKTPGQAQAAEANGADYLGSGAIFGTFTKLDTSKMEPDTLKAICGSVSIPVAAIGGIKSENILNLQGIGIAGAAVVSGIFAQENIEDAARELLNKIKQIV